MALLLLLALKYRWPAYYPTLDDYILFGGYPAYPHPWGDVIMRLGLLNIRPLAGLGDIYFWGMFWDMPYVALGIITVLHALCALVFEGVFRRMGVRVGAVFFGVFLLMPMGFEGAYWLSAATRIITGLFFASLAALALLEHFKKAGARRYLYLLLFGLLQLISFGFYEQVAAFSAALCLIIIFFERRGRGAALGAALFNIAALGAYYILRSGSGIAGTRGELVAPAQLWENLILVLERIFELFKSGLYELNVAGLSRAAKMLWAGGGMAVFYVAAAVLLAASAPVFCEDPDKKGKMLKALGLGALLFILPFSFYPFLKEPHMGYRNGFISLIGLGIFLDALLGALLRKKALYRGAAALLIMFLMAVNFAELNDYKAVCEADRVICENIVSALSPDVLRGEREVVVLNAKPYYAEQSARFAEHIYNLTQSDWALTGGVRARAKNLKIKRIIPVPGRLAPDMMGGDKPQILWLGEDGAVLPIVR